jgi:hypothetical protein
MASIEDIVTAFLRHIHKHDQRYGRWCVGITNDPARREREHRRFLWYARASSENAARTVEDALLELGCCGGRGGGLGDAVYVYIYYRG